MAQLLGGVARQLPGDVGKGRAFEGLAVNGGSDDRLVFAGEVLVEEFDHALAGNLWFLIHPCGILARQHIGRVFLEEWKSNTSSICPEGDFRKKTTYENISY